MAVVNQCLSWPGSFDPLVNCSTCPARGKGIFCDLPSQVKRDLQQIKVARNFAGEEVVFAEGQVPAGIYLLCKGRVRLSIGGSNENSVIIKVVEPGAVLGLNSAVSGHPMTVTATTVYPSALEFIRRSDFLEFLDKHPQIWRRVAQQLSRYCDTACGRIRSLGPAQTAAEKLARMLLEWSTSTPGSASPEAAMAPVTTHGEIGRMIGLSRETVSRLLSEFKRQRIAEIRGAKLRVIDPDALRRVSGL